MTKLDIVAEPGAQVIVITRVFDAPRALVFKVMTDPALIPKWWGSASLTTTVDKMDVKPGGIWRFIHGDPGNNEDAFHGVYHAIIAPERLVYTFEWEGLPGHAMLETVTFEEHDGTTTMTDIAAFPTTEERDGMIESGMESGATETMDRLAALLRTMA